MSVYDEPEKKKLHKDPKILTGLYVVILIAMYITGVDILSVASREKMILVYILMMMFTVVK